MSHNEIKARHERVAKGTTWDFNFTDGQLANKDRGELLDMLEKITEIIGMHDGGRIDEQDAYNSICEFMEDKRHLRWCPALLETDPEPCSCGLEDKP